MHTVAAVAVEVVLCTLATELATEAMLDTLLDGVRAPLDRRSPLGVRTLLLLEPEPEPGRDGPALRDDG